MPTPPSTVHPSTLRPGDVVRVVAPASPFDPALLDRGLTVLRSWGLEPRVRTDATTRRHYLAGTVDRRLDELHEAFGDPEARAILAIRGGYGVTTLLPRLRPVDLRARPRIVVGCSDLTALLSWCVDHVGIPAVHGPMVEALGRDDDPAGTERLRTLLFEPGKPPPLRSAMPDAYTWCLAPGIARGRAVGGSLTLIAALCGTAFQPNTDGAILLLEDVGERPYRIDRMLEQLDQSGVFRGVRGVVLGDFTRCDEPAGGATWRDAVDRVLRGRPIPILAGVPFGHGRPNLAIPVGVEVEVDAGEGELRFREAPFRAPGAHA